MKWPGQNGVGPGFKDVRLIRRGFDASCPKHRLKREVLDSHQHHPHQ